MDGLTHTMEDISTARGLPMPSPLLMPRLTHGTDGDMDGLTHTMEDISTARGLPMPSPLLMPRLTLWYGWGYGWPYAYHGGYLYGKRSADAEPTADAKAEPWWYGGYGYGAYGYWPYYG